MKLKAKKGFTLAELLIVVAIIAVLVTIGIPVFTTQLEKSREATDLANVRSAYAQLMEEIIGTDIESKSVTVDLVQKKDGWSTKLPIDIAGVVYNGSESESWIGQPTENGNCTITYTTKGTPDLVFVWSGSSGKSYTYNDFNGIVPATWKGAGGSKNNEESSSWYNSSLSTQKLVQLDPDSKYTLTFTIPSGYDGKMIQMGTLLFKDDKGVNSIQNDMVHQQRADSGWIGTNSQSQNDPSKNYQTVKKNEDGSITITQTITTDEIHLYFGANFYTGNNLTNNPKEKMAIEDVMNSMVINKNMD